MTKLTDAKSGCAIYLNLKAIVAITDAPMKKKNSEELLPGKTRILLNNCAELCVMEEITAVLDHVNQYI